MLFLKVIISLLLIAVDLLELSCLLNVLYKNINDIRISKHEKVELVITTIILVCLFVCWCYVISK